jgi:hypothetical protein
MIRQLEYQVPNAVFQNLKNEMPNFEHRINLNTPTGNFFYDKWEISSEFKNTIWQEVLESLPVAFGEARLMKLEPGNAYYSHADVDDRYHLNITGERSFLVDLDSNKLHAVHNNGYWYDMDAGRHHSAVNFGNDTRVQLVIRKLLQHNILNNSVDVQISTENVGHDYRFVFDDVFSPWLNRSIKAGYVNNFSYKSEQVSFTVEQHLLGVLEKMCPQGFKVTVCQ